MPLLFRREPLQPVLLALLYIALHRRYFRVKTLIRDTRVLKWLYEWCYVISVNQIDLEKRLMRGDTLTASEIERFARWLRMRDVAPIVGSSGTGEKRTAVVAPSTLNNYLSAAETFLLWAGRRYVSAAKRHGKIIYGEISEYIQDVLHTVRLRGTSPQKMEGLEASELEELFEILTPWGTRNPFRVGLQARNFLICEVLYQTGMRRGELLKLKVEDLAVNHEGEPYIRIVRRADDPHDWRLNEPAQKTRPREVAITMELYEALIAYVRRQRRPDRRGKPMKLSHSYLFVSERGYPLAEGQVNYVFQIVRSRMQTKKETLVHPHTLRHHFCQSFMDYCTTVEKIDEEAAKDRLKRFCGWSADSSMPERYTQKRLQQEANVFNLRRIAQARERRKREESAASS